MVNKVNITLPKLGESIVSATVLQWFKKVGDPIKKDEAILEVSTDKVNSEIPSPIDGVLDEILVYPGQEINVGEALAKLNTSVQLDSSFEEAVSHKTEISLGDKNFLSPSVMSFLQEKQLLDHIEKISRTGSCGRLTRKDVEKYYDEITNRHLKTTNSKRDVCDILDSFERVKMTPMRKAIADNMVKSFYQAPHATLVTEVDVTNVLKEITKFKELVSSVKITITTIVAHAIAQALKEFPLINSTLDQETIVVKKFVNIGIAVSIDHGVMVPVIKDCHKKSIIEIAEEISLLAQKTRAHRLDPQDTQEGTITLTNFGMTGTMIGIPIIRFPEVAIVGLGAITKKVMAMPDDSIAIRSCMMVSLTFDHRVLDGMYGCSFMSELKKRIESHSFAEEKPGCLSNK
jgi:2-oxoglutarate dehydrogenase E2 component (dihydrolipoamide succinyltransferase)